MFRIEFYVDDKNLGEAFKRLAGIARNLQHAYVPNLETEGKANGRAPRVKMTAADSQELFVKELRKHKLGDFRPALVRKVVSEMGFSPTSYSHFLNEAVRAGLVGKKKSPNSNGNLYFVKPEK